MAPNEHIANYLLIDGARVDNALDVVKSLNPEHECLYRGKSQISLAALAPYLFSYNPESPLAEEYLTSGWGNAWGVLVSCSHPMVDMVDHFRKFLIVHTEDYKELYFRFYDPRVLRLFLPTCDGKQLKDFFGPIKSFICEDEDPGFAIIFSCSNNTLVSEKMPAALLFSRVGAVANEAAMAGVADFSDSETTLKQESIDTIKGRPTRRFFS